MKSQQKTFLTLFVAVFLLISILPLTSAWFTRDHTRFTLQGFDEVNSPITEMCRPYMNVVLDGNTGNDLGVLHYVGDKVTSYIFPHTASGVISCDIKASTDVGLKCYCVGAKLHDIQDYQSHGINGFTTKYLKKYLGNNYLFHMVAEKNMENQNDKIYAETNPGLTARVNAYDKIVLNSLFPELGGDSKYMDITNQVAGIDMSNDAQIFRTAYVVDSSFFNTVYKDRTTIPSVFIVIPIGFILIGLLIIVLMFVFGKTGWKWFGIILGLFLLIIGLVIFYTFLTGTTWKVISLIITVPPKFGYMHITDEDVRFYDKITQEATNQFLTTGEFTIQDASGLSYVDTSGNFVTGALTQASKGSNYVTVILVAFILFSIVKIFFNSILDKKSRRGKYKGINKVLNILFYISLGLLVALLLYFLLASLF